MFWIWLRSTRSRALLCLGVTEQLKNQFKILLMSISMMLASCDHMNNFHDG